MMNKEGSIQIIIFMTPGAGVSCTRVWLYMSYSKNALFLKKSSSLLPEGLDKLSI